MATYNFLDYNGLKNLLTEINNYYASKAALTQLDTELRNKILQDLTAEDTQLKNLITQTRTALEDSLSSEQTSRENADQTLTESVNSLSAALDSAVQTLNAAIEQAVAAERQVRITEDNRLTEVDQAFTVSLAKEIGDRATKDTALENQITALNNTLDTQITNLSNDVDTRLSDLSGTLSATLKNYIDQKIVDLDFEGVKDIVIIPEGESLPETGIESYLYITSDHAIHQWVGISEDYPEGWKTLGEDSAEEIAALTDKITVIEGQVSDVETSLSGIDSRLDSIDERLDNTVDTDTYNTFVSAYDEKTEEVDQLVSELSSSYENLDQAIAEADQAITEVSQSVTGLDQAVTEITQTVTGLETEVASKISGITVNDEPVEIEDGIAHITVSGGGGEGTDPELRADFEAFKATVNPQLASFSDHLEDWENPHHVSKADLELDQVNNTSDEDKPISTATQAALDTKVDAAVYEEDLAGKISYGDIVDDLYTPDPERPLSANQGVEIDAAINEVKSSITALEAGLVFKGTVPSYNDLPVDAQNGFCYQIFSNTSDAHHGEIYAMTETGWVQIVASAQDMSSLIASQAEINKIITDYR